MAQVMDSTGLSSMLVIGLDGSERSALASLLSRLDQDPDWFQRNIPRNYIENLRDIRKDAYGY